MAEAYAGTIDDEQGTVADAMAELVATEEGDYGVALRQHWREIRRDDDTSASALICTRFAGEPFVTFAFTSHRDTGRGLATALVSQLADRLFLEGETTLALVVTEGNPAERIYRRLNFVDAPRPTVRSEPKSP